jgi:Pectate lyase superfamily protein
MRRRDLSRGLLAAAMAGRPSVTQAEATLVCAKPCYPPTLAEGVNGVAPSDLSIPPGNVLRWGADPTGTADSTAAIQRAVNVGWASGNYAVPWSGQGGATPVVLFPPGRYRVRDTVTIPTGVTLRGMGHPANTASHTRIIMDSSDTIDNRDKPIFRFNRATLDRSVLMNAAIASTIQELEFWYVTMEGTFDEPFRGRGIPFGKYPNGGALLFDVDATDTRIVNCVFQHAPAAIRIKGVPHGSGKRADGWTGDRGVGIFVENCEFDASCTHVFATGSELDLQFKACQFYGAMHRYEGCTGRVVYQSGRWHGSAYVDAATVPNVFTKFELKGADIETGSHAFVMLSKSTLIDISQNAVLGGTSADSWIEVTGADGGCVVSNAINNSGCQPNATANTTAATAAIKLIGCRNLLVSSNNITATEPGTYGGFGILCEDGSRPSVGNFVNGNAVSAPYDVGAYGGQSRRINVTAADILGTNYGSHPATNEQ